MSTVAITTKQQRLLDRINNRLDQLDAAARPAVAGIRVAADRLPPADRIAVKRRLQAIGAPDADADWASASVTDDLFSAKTLRRLARSAFAPLPGDQRLMLRTDVLARLLVERLNSTGPTTEAEAIDALDVRAPGRGPEVVAYALRAGLIRRVPGTDDEPATLEALGAPRSLAA